MIIKLSDNADGAELNACTTSTSSAQEIKRLSLNPSTIKKLSKILISDEDNSGPNSLVSSGSAKISEFLKSREKGFFDKAKYPDETM